MEAIQFIHSIAPWLREDRREVLLRRAVDEPVPAVEEHVHEVRDLTRAHGEPMDAKSSRSEQQASLLTEGLLSGDRPNFGGLVLGCIEAKCCQ